MSLREALTNIHRDPRWWRKVLIGGALSVSIIGVPWPVGYVVESMDNSRKGYPTPLPFWGDWGTRYLIGFFALLIDIIYFVFPAMVIGLLFFCAIFAITLTNPAGGPAVELLAPISFGFFGLLVFAFFLLGVAPIGRLIFTEEGRIEEAVSARALRESLRPGLRGAFGRARLQTLPAYLPALLLVVVFWQLTRITFPGSWVVAVLVLWLVCSAFFYAHLVVAQVYVRAVRPYSPAQGRR